MASRVIYSHEYMEEIENGTLVPSRVMAVEAHMLSCADCRGQVPADLQWMVNPREDVDATLSEAADRVAEAGVTSRSWAREGDPAKENEIILEVVPVAYADLLGL